MGGSYGAHESSKDINILLFIKCRMSDRDLGGMKQGPDNKGYPVVNGNIVEVNF